MDGSPILQNQDLLQGLAWNAQPSELLQRNDGASFAQWKGADCSDFIPIAGSHMKPP